MCIIELIQIYIVNYLAELIPRELVCIKAILEFIVASIITFGRAHVVLY